MSVSAISLLCLRVGTDLVLILTFRICLDVFQNSFELGFSVFNVVSSLS